MFRFLKSNKIPQIVTVSLTFLLVTSCTADQSRVTKIDQEKKARELVVEACAKGFSILGSQDDSTDLLISAAKLDRFYLEYLEAILMFDRLSGFQDQDIEQQIERAMKIKSLCMSHS
jgi:hypothetical protein